MQLTPDQQDTVIAALAREIARLDHMLNEYNRNKPRTSNTILKALADEGLLNVRIRIGELRALVSLLKGETDA